MEEMEKRGTMAIYDAVAALIDATRAVHMATVNVQLDALPCPPTSSGDARKVALFHADGDPEAIYYLTTIDPNPVEDPWTGALVPKDTALQKLEKAQAWLAEAQANPLLLGVVTSSDAAPAVEPGVPLEPQNMMVTTSRLIAVRVY